MSELIPGVPAAPPAAKTRPAAAVTLFRRVGATPAAGSVEVFWLQRAAELKFAGGFFAFPGGRVDARDSEIPVEGASGEDASFRAAAARELFEETGVLKARGAERLDKPTREVLRKRLLEEERVDFGAMLREHGLTLHATDFVDAGRYITPPSMPIRFDCRFFLVESPTEAEVDIWPGEIANGRWITPPAALELWTKGEVLLHPPQLHAMRVMSEFTSVAVAQPQLENPPYTPGFIPARVEFQRGVRAFALETPTLPPATHTNAYLLGTGDLLIVDPGSGDPRQYARLLAMVEGLKAEGMRPLAVLLTHHHADHVGGAAAVAERLKIPIWAHAKTADRLSFKTDRLLEDGEVLVLNGLPAMRWKVLHTPGHARGHITLVDEGSRSAVVGDMVAGMGTILIDPPEGDMSDYLVQLARLRELPVGALYPAHGPPLPNGVAKLSEYIRHRELREMKVLDAVKRSGGTLEEISARAYEDTPTAVPEVAKRSTQAILIKLTREAKILRQGEQYLMPG